MDCFLRRQELEIEYYEQRDGVYLGTMHPLDTIQELVVFCKLARARGAVPPKWSWRGFLESSTWVLLHYLKERTGFPDEYDPSPKIGVENVFTVSFKRPYLKKTADFVYGFEIGSDESEEYTDLSFEAADAEEPSVSAEFMYDRNVHAIGPAEFYRKIGGVRLWSQWVEDTFKSKGTSSWDWDDLDE